MPHNVFEKINSEKADLTIARPTPFGSCVKGLTRCKLTLGVNPVLQFITIRPIFLQLNFTFLPTLRLSVLLYPHFGSVLKVLKTFAYLFQPQPHHCFTDIIQHLSESRSTDNRIHNEQAAVKFVSSRPICQERRHQYQYLLRPSRSSNSHQSSGPVYGVLSSSRTYQ